MSIVTLLLFILTISLVVMVLFLIGKVRDIENLAAELLANLNLANESKNIGNSDPSFFGLKGKKLWDIISLEEIANDLSDSDIEIIRSRFRTVLLKHINHIFFLGIKDAKDGKQRKIPSNENTYQTLRGEIQVWIPTNYVKVTYNNAYDAINSNEENTRYINKIRETLYELFRKIELDIPEDFMDSLASKIHPKISTG
jgi:hypothetical protein